MQKFIAFQTHFNVVSSCDTFPSVFRQFLWRASRVHWSGKAKKRALCPPPPQTPSSTPWWPYPRPTCPTMAYPLHYKQLGNHPNGFAKQSNKIKGGARTLFYPDLNLDLPALYLRLQAATCGRTLLQVMCFERSACRPLWHMVTLKKTHWAEILSKSNKYWGIRWQINIINVD